METAFTVLGIILAGTVASFLLLTIAICLTCLVAFFFAQVSQYLQNKKIKRLKEKNRRLTISVKRLALKYKCLKTQRCSIRSPHTEEK